jgi:hypothetical protein
MLSVSRHRTAMVVFAAVAGVYSLVAWDRLLEPSPQFHFVDLAHSLMAGQLHTETPKLSPSKSDPADPVGYRDAIRRSRESGGWNDWAALRTLTLADGTVLTGRFPWPDSDGDRKKTFHTLDGESWQVDVRRDLRADCEGRPGKRCDDTTHYVSFPPGPAFVMMPFAAIWGYDTNDVLITALFGGLNAVLLFWLLQLLAARGHTSRGRTDNLWLTMMFALGSVAFFSSVRGEVWFTALVFGVTFNLCFMLAALDLRRPVLAGLLLGLGMATRTPMAFCFVFFAWQLFFPGGRWERGRWPEIFKRGALFAVPILLIGVGLMLYNQARFGQPFEFGHSLLAGGAGGRIRDHGLFNTWYLNGNLSAALINLPRLLSEAPFISISKHGLSLLFTTPALFLLARPRVHASLGPALWATVFAAAVPGLLYQNTGWEQFGYRFGLDYFPYLVALLACGGRPLTRRVKGVIVFGVVVNLFGAITFGRFAELYY